MLRNVISLVQVIVRAASTKTSLALFLQYLMYGVLYLYVLVHVALLAYS